MLSLPAGYTDFSLDFGSDITLLQTTIGLGDAAVEYYNGSSWSQLQGTSWSSAVDTTEVQWADAAWALGNYQVSQSPGEPFTQINGDGTWSTTGPNAALPGIAALNTLPNLPWANGQPALSTNTTTLDSGFGLSLNSAGQFASAAATQASDSQGSFLVQAPAIWQPQTQLNSSMVSELFNNYLYDWTSIPFSVSDGRQNLAFAASGVSQPINQIQPVYQLTQTPGLQVQQQLLPLQVEQTVYTTTTVPLLSLAPAPVADGQPQPFASLRGRSLTLNSTGSGAANLLSGTVLTSSTTSSTGLTVNSAGSLQLGTGATAAATAAQGLTLVGQAPEIQAAAITVNGPLAAVTPNQAPASALSLNAGSGTLSLLASLAPVEVLDLSAASLLLPANGTVSAQVQSVTASNGSSSFSTSSPGDSGWIEIQLSANSSGAPSGLVISGSPTPSGDASGDQGIVLGALSGIAQLALHTGATLQLPASLTLNSLQIDAGSLAASDLAAASQLSLRLTGSEPVDYSSVLLQAPVLSLESFGGGQFVVDSPSLNLASNQPLSVTQQGTAATALTVNAGGTSGGGTAASIGFSVSSAGDLLVSDLQASGNVSLTSGGAISLTQVNQAAAAILQLIASEGIGLATGSGAAQLSLGQLQAVAGGAINLEASQLRGLTATAGGDLSVLSTDPTQLSLGSLTAAGDLEVNTSNGSLLVSDPSSLSGTAISLLSGGLLQINTDLSSSLGAASSLTLVADEIATDVNALTLTAGSDASGSNGSVWLEWLNFANADALPPLPLVIADQLSLASATGLRLTASTFHPDQSQWPFQTLAFLQADAAGSGQASVPQYHPYRSQSQWLEDAAGVVYTLDANGALISHFDPGSGLYQYTALPLASSSLAQAVIGFSAGVPQITAANLASALLPAGVSASDLDLSTVLPVFQAAPSGTSVVPTSTGGTPLASAVAPLPNGQVNNQASASSTTPATAPSGTALLQTTQALLNLLTIDQVVSISGSVESSPLQAAEVWVDVNGDWIHQAGEPTAETRADGSFRLAVPSDLLAAADAGATPLPLVASGGIDTLSGQSMQGLRLLGSSGEGALTPLTTLATLLRLGGSTEPQIQALQRAFGAALTSGDPDLARFEPYAVLASDGVRGLRQAFSHSRLAALLLLIAPATVRDQLSPAAEASRLAAAAATVAPQLATASTPQARQEVQVALLRNVLERFYPQTAASLREAALNGYRHLADAYDALEIQALAAGQDRERLRTLLAASGAIKGTMLPMLTERWTDLLGGRISAAAWLAQLTTTLAQGGVTSSLLGDDHSVALLALADGVLPGGTALVEVRLGQPAPDQGLVVQLFVEAPQGSQLDDGRPAAGGQRLTIPAGTSAGTLTIRIPMGLASNTRLRVQLLAVDSGFILDPSASLAAITIAVPGQSAAPAPGASNELVGSGANDLLDPQQAPTLERGQAGADSFVLRQPPAGQGVDAISDFQVAEGDRLLALRQRFPGASISDFELLDGSLRYRGTPIALVSRQGQPLTRIADLAGLLKIVDTASAVSKEVPQDPKPIEGDKDQQPTTPASSPSPVSPIPVVSPAAPEGEPSRAWALALTSAGSGVVLATGGGTRNVLIELQAGGSGLRKGESLQVLVAQAGSNGKPSRRDVLLATLRGKTKQLSSRSSKTLQLRPGEQLRFGVRSRQGRIRWLNPQPLAGDASGLIVRVDSGSRQGLSVGLRLI